MHQGKDCVLPCHSTSTTTYLSLGRFKFISGYNVNQEIKLVKLGYGHCNVITLKKENMVVKQFKNIGLSWKNEGMTFTSVLMCILENKTEN